LAGHVPFLKALYLKNGTNGTVAALKGRVPFFSGIDHQAKLDLLLALRHVS